VAFIQSMDFSPQPDVFPVQAALSKRRHALHPSKKGALCPEQNALLFSSLIPTTTEYLRRQFCLHQGLAARAVARTLRFADLTFLILPGC
jgi:hypothetical protein